MNPLSQDFFLYGLINLVTNILDYLNPLSNNFILKTVIQNLVNMLNYLNPLSDNFFGYKLIDLLKSALQLLFVPSQEKIIAIPNLFKQKFAFVDSIKTGIDSIKSMSQNMTSLPSLTIPIPNNRTGVNELTIIDLSWYAPYKSYGDTVITGFVYLFFLWRVYCHIPAIINGVSTFEETSYKIASFESSRGKR